jgi:hypothetical protein
VPTARAPAPSVGAPGAEAPGAGTLGTFPSVTSLDRQASARTALQGIGYAPKTGMDNVARLIPQSTSGMLEGAASTVKGAITGTSTPGREAAAQLTVIVSRMTFDLANGKLGAGFSNADREFLASTLADAGDINIPWNERLAAWRSAREILERNAGYTPVDIPPMTRAPYDRNPGTGAGGRLPGASATPAQRQAARNLLIANPSTAAYYDSNFGAGEAAKVLREGN